MSAFRRYFLSLVLLLAASPACADPCETLLCMAGKVQGQSGGSACTQPIADYFSIEVFGRHHSFNPGATAAARLNYLNSCPNAGSGNWPSKINAAYGTVRQ